MFVVLGLIVLWRTAHKLISGGRERCCLGRCSWASEYSIWSKGSSITSFSASFAQKMIDDHGAANAKLESVAGDQKLKVPTQLDAKHKTDLEKLQSAKAPVDEPYLEMQRTAHADAVKLFESYASDGDNAALKTFAKDMVPTLKAHQQMVEDIASKMAAGPSSTSSTTPAVNTTDTPNTGALVPGANSFTEDQARSRIQDAGYSDVSDLKKDDQGIWRGQAMKNGKSTAVGLDYQGNIVASTN